MRRAVAAGCRGPMKRAGSAAAPGVPPDRRAGGAGARPSAPRLRGAPDGAPRPPDRRADPDGALAVDQRPQPRRRLPAPARAPARLGGGPRRAAGRGRGGDPPGGHLEGQVGAHPGDPAGDARGRPPRGRRGPRAVAGLACDGCPSVEARDYLVALPGVGRKTAACVLLFAYGLREVPVDTHVSRVGMRLGAAARRAPFEELHEQMLALTPPGQELELHVNLLRHGRRTCHARGPACGQCALARMCPSRAACA